MQRLIGYVDANGEVHEGSVLALMMPKRTNGFYEGWVAVAQDAFLALANSGLGLEARRVLDILLAYLDFENWIHLPQVEIAAMLNMKRANVSRAMRDLEKIGVILRGPKIGRSFTYRINPNFGWKGSAKNHREALKADLQERMRERGLSVVPSNDKTSQPDKS